MSLDCYGDDLDDNDGALEPDMLTDEEIDDLDEVDFPDPADDDGRLAERFADPGGESALYPASAHNPRDRPCPTCKRPNVLTRMDVHRGYQCDDCARKAERGID